MAAGEKCPHACFQVLKVARLAWSAVSTVPMGVDVDMLATQLPEKCAPSGALNSFSARV